MANQVYANMMEVSCKSAAGKSICAFPDVCFTPPQTPATPPGVPIPYPNTGMASDCTSGSTSVKISGNEVMLKNKSYFKKSTGDEAGCAPKKGVVTSKNTGKVYFTAWSMDVKVEGENVVRHLDMTTHNHASQGPNAAPTAHVDAMAAASDQCTHANIKRDPEKDEHEINQQNRKESRDRSLARKEAKVERILDKAVATQASDPARANELLDAAAELDHSLKGDKFERHVANDTNAKEVAVKITCKDCGLVIAEFDVVTDSGIVKECKASWNQVNEDQFKREQALAQRPDIFGPGTVVHIAVPKGQRGRLDRKFKDKANASGKIQEH
jgi:Domain of unknown function (DUF4150)